MAIETLINILVCEIKFLLKMSSNELVTTRLVILKITDDIIFQNRGLESVSAYIFSLKWFIGMKYIFN